jgi:hypothetical protein
MSDELEAAVGEGLVALGLYAACFESMVLAFRATMHEYLKAHEPRSLPAFSQAMSHGAQDLSVLWAEPGETRSPR